MKKPLLLMVVIVVTLAGCVSVQSLPLKTGYVVESIPTTKKKADPDAKTALGAVAGGAAGVAIGNQIGKGNGRKAARIVGGLLGAATGAAIATPMIDVPASLLVISDDQTGEHYRLVVEGRVSKGSRITYRTHDNTVYVQQIF